MKFSIMHPSRRLPEGWRAACTSWFDQCDNPDEMEYLLVIDAEDMHHLGTLCSYDTPAFMRRKIIFNNGPRGTVPCWNAAAAQAKGQVLICAADDLFPCPHWDTLIESAIGDLTQEAVLWVDMQDPWPNIMTHPILTRAYYLRPGRGGMPNGELFYPEYISVGNDDDFTEYSQYDWVVIDKRQDIHFDHRHYSQGKSMLDATYIHSNRPEAWARREQVLTRRRACRFQS